MVVISAVLVLRTTSVVSSCTTQNDRLVLSLSMYAFVSLNADVHCCVILAASAFINEMSSKLMRKTKRRPAI